MPVPKKKVSRSRRNMRRAHLALVAPNFSTCPKCGASHRPHCVCEACGTYKEHVLPKHILRPSFISL